MITHLDLFSGIGGFALAARWADLETVAFCEIDPFCRKVLKKHWPGVLKYMDIRDVVNPGPVDLLTAGFPCQPFSIAGKQRGKDDERYLWPETLRIIRTSKPAWLILENVSGIVPYLDQIIQDLENENYDWRSYLIPASAVGAPHKRERLWIIAHDNSHGSNDRFSHREGRCLQENEKWHLAQIQSTWPQLITNSWSVMQAGDWLSANAGFSRINDGVPYRMDRIKSLGNAVVPHIPYVFMSVMKLLS